MEIASIMKVYSVGISTAYLLTHLLQSRKLQLLVMFLRMVSKMLSQGPCWEALQGV